MAVSTEKEKLAHEMGVDATKISDYMHNYVLEKMQEGVLADLDIGYFRAKGRLSAGDLGIQMSKEEEEYVSLGHQKLLPPEIVKDMERAEGRGRANLEKKTIPLTLGRFLPVTASVSFHEENEAQMEALFEVRDMIVKKYDEIVRQIQEEFRKRAYAVYDRLEQKPQEHRDSWAARYAEGLVKRIPDKKTIYDSFYWKVRYHFVPLPSAIEAERLRLQEIKEKQTLLTYESDDKKRQIRELNEKVLAQMRQQQEEAAKQTKSFLEETVFKLRTVVLTTVQKAMETMKRNDGKLMGSTVKSLENLVSQAEMLNFHNDQEVAGFVDRLKSQLATKSAGIVKAPQIEKIMKEMEIAMGRSVRAVEKESTKRDELARIIGKGILKTSRRVE